MASPSVHEEDIEPTEVPVELRESSATLRRNFDSVIKEDLANRRVSPEASMKHDPPPARPRRPSNQPDTLFNAQKIMIEDQKDQFLKNELRKNGHSMVTQQNSDLKLYTPL